MTITILPILLATWALALAAYKDLREASLSNIETYLVFLLLLIAGAANFAANFDGAVISLIVGAAIYLLSKPYLKNYLAAFDNKILLILLCVFLPQAIIAILFFTAFTIANSLSGKRYFKAMPVFFPAWLIAVAVVAIAKPF